MRPEEFDHRLQQKLDELNPSFNEKDWIRLSKKMKRDKTPLLFINRYGMILLLISFAILGSWLTYHWMISTPSSQNEIENSAVPIQIAKVSEAHENDYSKIASTTSTTDPLSIAKNTVETSSTSLTNTNSAVQNKYRNTRTQNSGTHEVHDARRSTHINQKIQNNTSENLTFQNAIGVTDLKSGENVHQTNLSSNVEDPDGAGQNSSLANHDIRNSIQESSENQISALSVVEPVQMLAVEGISFNSKAIKGRIKPVAGFKTHKWIVGTTGLVAASHVNPGIAFEIKTKKNISFGSGLVVQKYLEQRYRDQTEFSAENASDFTELIRPRHSKSVSFSDIKINSTDVLLPLNLKYYFPLNSKFALFANASMQLTLHSKTSLDFQFVTLENLVMNETDFEQASNSATLINHFTLGAGIQREFRNFIFQTSFQLQKNNSNQPHITKQEMVGQIGVFYKL